MDLSSRIKSLPNSVKILGGMTIILAIYFYYSGFTEEKKIILGLLGVGALFALMTDDKPHMISPDEAKRLVRNDLDAELRRGDIPNGKYILHYKAPKIDGKYHSYMIGCFLESGLINKPIMLKVVDAWTSIITQSFPLKPDFNMMQIKDRYTSKGVNDELMKLVAVMR